jgi:hypothetical protein
LNRSRVTVENRDELALRVRGRSDEDVLNPRLLEQSPGRAVRCVARGARDQPGERPQLPGQALTDERRDVDVRVELVDERARNLVPNRLIGDQLARGGAELRLVERLPLDEVCEHADNDEHDCEHGERAGGDQRRRDATGCRSAVLGIRLSRTSLFLSARPLVRAFTPEEAKAAYLPLVKARPLPARGPRSRSCPSAASPT